tara:strand:- start:875 stop:1279 length:405 start_codon:yes stop_codon:yes gene_type:complete
MVSKKKGSGNLFDKTKNIFRSNYTTIVIAIVIISFVVHLVYVLSTKFTKTITVKKTYTGVEDESSGNGYYDMYTTYMVVDTNNEVYQVSNSLWFWEWDAPEEWGKLSKGQTYTVNGYGKRVGFFGMYPQIVKVE